MLPPTLAPYLVGAARIEETPDGVRFVLDGASAASYSDSQLDDFHGRSRAQFPWRPPLRLSLRARFSHGADALQGTAGFGWWNAPFAGDRATTTAAGPQVLWFFFASPPAMLATGPGWRGNGWFAQGLNTPTLPNWFVRLGMLALRLPWLKHAAHRAAQGTTRAAEHPLPDLDLTAWHHYAIHWLPHRADFYVDDALILTSPTPPSGPLALVLWMDNQWATTSGQGGLLAVPGEQWLEVADVIVNSE